MAYAVETLVSHRVGERYEYCLYCSNRTDECKQQRGNINLCFFRLCPGLGGFTDTKTMNQYLQTLTETNLSILENIKVRLIIYIIYKGFKELADVKKSACCSRLKTKTPPCCLQK